MKKLILATIDNIPDKDFEIIDFVSFSNTDISTYERWYVERLRRDSKEDFDIIEIRKGFFGKKKEIILDNPLKVLQLEEKVDAIIGIKSNYFIFDDIKGEGRHSSDYGGPFNLSLSINKNQKKYYIGTAIRFKTNKK